MGNHHSSSIVSRTGGALDTFVAELGQDVVYDKSLGSSRFLKAVKCRHRNGYLVVKIFIKPDTNPLDEKYLRRLKKEKKALQDVTNVYAYQAFFETERAGFLIRQWVASSLYDRISTRPFLTTIEKKWIVFQLITGLRDARKRKVSHGDIKSENILVTSWNWVYLTDFASSKPTYLPLDNPSDFAFYYDTSGRRNCYIAPERFFSTDKSTGLADPASVLGAGAALIGDAASSTVGASGGLGKADGVGTGSREGKRDGKVTEAMDVFSAGCVIAELFLEGAALFTLSQLFKYREKELDVDTQMAPIEEEPMRDLIKQMISLDPSARPSFDAILHASRGSIFPECFYAPLHDLVSSVNDLSVSSPFASAPPAPSSTPTPTLSVPQARSSTVATDDRTAFSEGANAEANVLPTDSDRRIDRIWAEFDILEPHMLSEQMDKTTMPVKIDYTRFSASKPIQNIIPVVVNLPSDASRQIGHKQASTQAPSEDGPALIILSLLCANIRNCSLPSSKLRVLDLMLVLALYLTDEAKLDRMLPYVLELLRDDAPIVRAAALRTLLQILTLVTAISPFNSDIFPQYIFPALHDDLGKEQDVSVRCILAQCVAPLASLAVTYLEMGQALRAHGSVGIGTGAPEYDDTQYEVSYDACMEDLQKHIEDLLSALLVDSSSVVKRAVLLDIAPLCIFLGRQKTNDILLSHMITYLNDRDWMLRYAFFDSIVDVAMCLGGRSLEEYILPLMLQALADAEETVVAKVLSSLTALCELGLFQKMRIWELMSATLALLYHPNVWIRHEAVAFIASASKRLPDTDVWCILYPSLKHYLRSDVRTVDIRSILTTMKAPLPRHIYDVALEWAMKSENSLFWKPGRQTVPKIEPPREVGAAKRVTKAPSRVGIPKSEEDELQLYKLEQLGMTPSEETKLITLRDYLLKLANSVDSIRSRLRSETENEMLLQTTGHVELQKLGVVPQTIFLGSRASYGEQTRRPTSDNMGLRTPTPEKNRLSRVSSFERATGGGAYEDLRRRLAIINGSATSLSSSPTSQANRDRRSSVTLVQGGRPSPIHASDLPQTPTARPGSPTESLVSTANSVPLKPRFAIGGTDMQKAAPAVGSNKTNAMGLLEAPGRSRGEVSPERAEWASPASFADAIRGVQTSSSRSINEDGQDSTLTTLLEHMYADLNRDAQSDFGPRVHEGPIRRRNTARQGYSSRDTTRRGLSASLVAHLTSHTEAVNGLAVSPDHLFFVSCSDDKTVKVWDTARLERNVTSKPRHTYGQHHARVKCVCILEGYHCFASAADDGSLHVVRVYIAQSGSLPKYGKLHVVREHRVERAGEYITYMKSYNTDTAFNLVYATSHCAIVVLELKTMRVTQCMNNPIHLGPIVSLCLDRKRTWLVAATLNGNLTLWDLRFGLLLRTWAVGGSTIKSPARIRQCAIHPTKGRGRWIIVAIEGSSLLRDAPGTVLMEVWDVEKPELVECFVYRESPTELDDVLDVQLNVTPSTEISPTAAIAALVQSRQTNHQHDTSERIVTAYPGNRSPSDDSDPLTLPSVAVSSLVVGVELGGQAGAPRAYADLGLDSNSIGLTNGISGFMIAGSEDCKLTLWDLTRVAKSAVLSGREDDEKLTFSTRNSPLSTVTLHIATSSGPSSGASNLHGGPRSAWIAQHQQTLLRAHQDCITAVICIDSPFRGGLVSADKSGVIKVWRIEGL